MSKVLAKNISRSEIWYLAIRPKTLIASFSPVLIGTALARKITLLNPLILLLTLLFAVLIQIGTNLANDYFDFVKGADNENRKGPLRVTQAGLVSKEKMKFSVLFVFSLAFLVSLYLIFIGGVLIAALMVLAILFGVLYTGGPYPLGYLGLGDILVLIFFGPVATFGTYFLQTNSFDLLPLLVGLGPGCFSTALLAINNLRDIEEDKAANKNTLIVRFGEKFGQFEYFFTLLIAFSIPIFLAAQGMASLFLYFTLLLTPLVLPLIKKVFKDSENLNPLLPKTAELFTLYTLLFSISLL